MGPKKNCVTVWRGGFRLAGLKWRSSCGLWGNGSVLSYHGRAVKCTPVDREVRRQSSQGQAPPPEEKQEWEKGSALRWDLRARDGLFSPIFPGWYIFRTAWL